MDHSFVVLAYKESPFIEQCIDSLLAQRVQSQIIVSTSTPSTFLDELCARKSLQLICSAQGGTIAKDWTNAYNLASTKYVTLAHQDDTYYPNYSSLLLRLCNRYPGTLIAFSGYDELYDGRLRSSNLNLIIKRLMLAAPYLFRDAASDKLSKQLTLAFGCPIACPSVMFNKEQIGSFAFSNELKVNVDWDAWQRIAKRPGSFAYERTRCMAHRIYQDSQTSIGLKENIRQNEDMLMFQRFWPLWMASVLARVYSLSYHSNS